jgi:antagonist of KipI
MERPLAALTVLTPGLCSLVVDAGRPSSRSLGVPVGGAADRAALALGNALLDNPPDAAALEVCLTGPTLLCEGSVGAVLVGAPFELSSDRQDVRAGKTFTLTADERLRIGGTPTRARAYLCVRGGLRTPVVLGSRSSLAPLRAADRLPCEDSAIPSRFARLAPFDDEADGVTPLRVLPGLQIDWFPPGLFDAGLPALTFAVAAESNRMGTRLRGPALPVPAREMTSEPVCPGAVQVTRDGQCVVLGVDAQTIGGYPKVAHVIDADHDRLAQLRPGDAVRFVPVGLAEGERLGRERRRRLADAVLRLRTAAAWGIGWRSARIDTVADAVLSP